jgi:hypothetical protein
MKKYTEQREFVLRLEAVCEFPDDYDGDLDGYAWTEELRAMAGEIVAAAAQAVARHPGWSLHGKNRGRSSDDEVTLVLERSC